MPENNALYVYGIAKGPTLKWKKTGLDGKKVYIIRQSNFSALVHDCEEKPYLSENPNKIKELIIVHNMILDAAIKVFGGVIPLSFNTIIKKGENSAQDSLKNWMSVNEKTLEKTWDKMKNKNEYGCRIYYNKDKLFQESSCNKEVKKIKDGLQGKKIGLNYLLQSKIESKINEIVYSKINETKQKFYNDIKKITEDIKINTSQIFINENKDLLLSISILAEKQQIDQVKVLLEENSGKDFSFQLAGPFAPYSFV